MKLPPLAWRPPLAPSDDAVFRIAPGVAGAIGLINTGDVMCMDHGLPTGWSEKRTLEHRTGRALSALAQRALSLPETPVPRRGDGLPIWPMGTCGSIAHTDTHAIAVLSRNTAIRALGVDLERADGVTQDLHTIILTPSEQATCAPGDSLRATAIFSAKEAVYKALYPIEQEIFDFQDVTIEWSERSFRAIASGSRGALLEAGVGVIAVAEGQIATIFIMPAAASPTRD